MDHPPLSILLLRGIRGLLGDSIWSIRLLPAVAGALTVLLVGLMARALGGGLFAQWRRTRSSGRTVDMLVGIVRALPAEDRARAVVFAPNYGVAGAVEFLGRKERLRAISGHNNYWLWGPEGASGEIVIVVDGDPDDLGELFGRFEQVATTDCGYCMPYENKVPVFLCREPRVDLRTLWPTLKHYD